MTRATCTTNPYRKQPRGAVVANREPFFTYDQCLHTAASHPDYSDRRIAVLRYPEILDTWMESGMCRKTIATILGFSHWNQLRYWLWNRDLLDSFMEAYRDTADLFFDAASIMELHATGIQHPSFTVVAHQYHQFTPKELRRMAGRNNPDKYTRSGKLRTTPATPAAHTPPAFSAVKFTGSWTPGMAV